MEFYNVSGEIGLSILSWQKQKLSYTLIVEEFSEDWSKTC